MTPKTKKLILIFIFIVSVTVTSYKEFVAKSVASVDVVHIQNIELPKEGCTENEQIIHHTGYSVS